MGLDRSGKMVVTVVDELRMLGGGRWIVSACSIAVCRSRVVWDVVLTGGTFRGSERSDGVSGRV